MRVWQGRGLHPEIPLRPQSPRGTSVADKLHANLTKRGRCVEWTGRVDKDGYGIIALPRTRGRHKGAHVVAWEQVHGPVPDGMQVCHRCDNPPCCEESHLFLSDAVGNQADKVAKGRHARGSTVGTSVLTEAQVFAIRAAFVPRRVTAKVLAARYGVSKVTVDRILQRRAWTHI